MHYDKGEYRKIPKISPGDYILQRPFLRGLFLEVLMYGGKFAFQNRLGQLVVGRKFTIFALFYFVFEGKFQVQAPRGAYIRRGDLTGGFLRYEFGGLIFGGRIHGGDYFRNFTVTDSEQLAPCMSGWPLNGGSTIHCNRESQFFLFLTPAAPALLFLLMVVCPYLIEF